ncbi:MAG: SMP-30/gluconolactonase/LRE family protein [Lautropia sp.]
MNASVECLHDSKDELGECPVWNDRDQSLYWVDCIGARLSSITPADGRVRSWKLPEFPGSFAFRDDAGLVMALRRGLALVSLGDGTAACTRLDADGFDPDVQRFNDGACDRRGRFWAGTFDRRLAEPIGSLYRLSRDHSARRMDTGIMMSNGIAWSPDDRTMYYTDSRPGRIYAYDFDPDDGAIGNRRVFLDYAGSRSRPDGCAIDSAGGLWVAEVDGSRAARYTPQGRLDRVIELPVTRPSSLAFGGSDLSTLFITTLRHGVPEDALHAQPLAGAVLTANPGVSGLPQPRFAG